MLPSGRPGRDRGRREFRNWQLQNEFRADGRIVLDANGAMMFGHNSARDGQAEPGPAIFGREVRQEKPVFIFRRNSMAAVRNDNFHSFTVGVKTRAQKQLFYCLAFH